jgi:hypothetical protein
VSLEPDGNANAYASVMVACAQYPKNDRFSEAINLKFAVAHLG